MTLKAQMLADLELFFSLDDFAEKIEYQAAVYPQPLPMNMIIVNRQPDGEVINDYIADRLTVQVRESDFVVSGWDDIVPAKNDLLYRNPDDLQHRQAWKVRKGPKLETGVYTLELEKSGRVVPR